MNFLELVRSKTDVQVLKAILEVVTTAELNGELGHAFTPSLLKRCPKCQAVLNKCDEVCPNCKATVDLELGEATNLLPHVTSNLGVSLISRDELGRKIQYPVNMYLDLLNVIKDKIHNNKGIIIKKKNGEVNIGFLFGKGGKEYYYPALALGLDGFSGSLFHNLINAIGYNIPAEQIRNLKDGQYRIGGEGMVRTKIYELEEVEPEEVEDND